MRSFVRTKISPVPIEQPVNFLSRSTEEQASGIKDSPSRRSRFARDKNGIRLPGVIIGDFTGLFLKERRRERRETVPDDSAGRLGIAVFRSVQSASQQ